MPNSIFSIANLILTPFTYISSIGPSPFTTDLLQSSSKGGRIDMDSPAPPSPKASPQEILREQRRAASADL